MIGTRNALACVLLVASFFAASAEAARKYHPGHYVAVMRGMDSHATMTASIRPGVVGIMKRYTWRSLEPRQGQYDFSEIQADLHWAQAHGMRLVAMIEDKTFVQERPTPAYLDHLTLRNRTGGYTALRWHPTVVARKKALLRALGRFDSNWALEGMALQESALGFDDAVLRRNGYTPEKYRDALIGVLREGASALPQSRMFWFMNFLPGRQQYIASVANAVAAHGVVMGGPDVMPDDRPLREMAYPFYAQFRGRMPLFGQVESICYAHPHKTGGYQTRFWTMPELFRYARDRLHVDYMFWVRIPKPPVRGAHDWTDALPVIQMNPSFGLRGS